MRLKDFYTNTEYSIYESKLDVDSLMELFDGDFIRLQETEMQAHSDFCKGNGILEIKCDECNYLIEGPKDLVRYFGVNMHEDCFRISYPNEKRKLNEVERKYFDRVYSLIILGKRETLF